MYSLFLICIFTIVHPTQENCKEHLEKLENVEFPYECTYEDGMINYFNTIESEHMWIPAIRITHYYYEQFSNDFLYRHPVFQDLFGIQGADLDCIMKTPQGIVSSSCQSKAVGYCLYMTDCDNFCTAYDQICGNPNCAQFSQVAKKQHFCQVNQDLEQKSMDEKSLYSLLNNCSICDERFLEYPNPTITIYMYNTSNLIVNVTNIWKLKSQGALGHVICFGEVPILEIFFRTFGPYLGCHGNESTGDTEIWNIALEDRIEGRVWCTGFAYPNMEVIRSNTVIIRRYMDSYKFSVLVETSLRIDHHSITLKIYEVLSESGLVTSVHPVEIVPVEDPGILQMFLQITTTNQNTFDIVLNIVNDYMALTNFTCSVTSCDFCLESVTNTSGYELKWPRIPINTKAETREKCFDKNGRLVTRSCRANYVEGAYWSEVSSDCINSGFTQATSNLSELINSDSSIEDINIGLVEILSNVSNLISYDVHLASNLVEKIAESQENFSMQALSTSVSLLMDSPEEILSESQEEFGATDKLLKNFVAGISRLVENLYIQEGEEFIDKNLILKMVDVVDSSMTIMVYEDDIIVNYNLLSIEEIKKMGLLFGVHFQKDLIKHIRQETGQEEVKMAFTMYKNDNLFIDNVPTLRKRSLSFIPNIFIPNLELHNLPYPLQVIFKQTNEDNMKKTCEHWLYGNKSSSYGKWAYDSDAKTWYDFFVCDYTHTSFMGLCATDVEEPIETCRKHNESLGNVGFPYNCKFEDGMVNENSIIHLEEEKVWYPVQQVANAYFQHISHDIFYKKPFVLSNILGTKEIGDKCVLRIDGELTYASCNEKAVGFCQYTNNCDDFCSNYDKICGRNGCSQYYPATKKHYCQDQQGIERNLYDASQCQICKQKYDNYPSPKINIEMSSSTGLIIIEVIGPLKLKKLDESIGVVNCISDVYNTFSYNKYISVFGPYLGVYSKISSEKSENVWNYTLDIQIPVPGRVWCEAFEYPNMNLITSNTILVKPKVKYGYDFALEISRDKMFDHNEIRQNIIDAFASNSFEVIQIRPVKLLSTNETDVINILFHITTPVTFKNLSETLTEMASILNSDSITYSNLRSSEFCLEDITVLGDYTLTWPQTPTNKTAIPKEICLTVQGKFVTRKCLEEFVSGAYWSDIIGFCAKQTFSEITEDLHNILNSNKSSEKINENLQTTLMNVTNFVPYDVYLVTNIIYKIANSLEEFSIDILTSSIDLMMDVDDEILRKSQKNMGAADSILANFDDASGRAIGFNESVKADNISFKNVALKYVSFSDNSSLAILFDEKDIKILYNIKTLDEIAENNFQLAIYLPEDFLQYINENQTEQNAAVIIVYKNDSFFIEDENSKYKSISWIPSMFIPGLKVEDCPEFQIIFKPTQEHGSQKYCAHWSYGYNENFEFDLGNWQQENEAELWQEYHICKFSHMTHFGLLVGATYEDKHEQILHIITLIGSVCSLIGIVGIFVTAFLFKLWREEDSTKVLLNLSFANVLQTIFMYIGHEVTFNENYVFCIAVGAILHYSILCNSFWMLIVSYMQYQRMVLVFFKEINNFIMVSALFAWGTPLFIVLPLVLTLSDSYINGTFCYLQGNILFYALFLPICAVTLINLLLFWEISINIWCKKQETQTGRKLHFQFVIFLFFLMGLTWIFGIFNGIYKTVVLSYLFSISASLQGFALFVFCVMLNEKTKRYWFQWVRRAQYKMTGDFLVFD